MTFHQLQKEKNTSLYPYYFGPKHKFERNGPKNSFWGLIGYGNSCMD